MAVSKTTVPVHFNVYLPKTTNNPYIKNAISYATTLASKTVTTGTGITDDPASDTAYTDGLPSDTTIEYKSFTGSLTYGTEHKVFTLVFVANSGYVFDSGGFSLIKKRIIGAYPRYAQKHEDFTRNKEQSVNENYANRWRFVETVSVRDSNKLATTVSLVAYYTTPDYRAEDALQSDGTVITAVLEKAKTRGLMLVPMMKKGTAAISSTISTIIAGKIQKEFDGTEIIEVAPQKANTTFFEMRGTSGAAGQLIVSQKNGIDLGVLNHNFTMPASGVIRKKIRLPRVSADEFLYHLVPNSGTTLGSGVPSDTSKNTIHKFAKPKITIAAVQSPDIGLAGTGFTASNVVKGDAFQSFKNVGNTSAFATASTTVNSTYHKALTDEELQDASHYAFKLLITPDSTKVQLDAGIGAISGYASSFTVNNFNFRNNGGTICTIKHLFLIEVGNNVEMYGYVAVEKLGKSDVALTISVNGLMTNT